MGQQARAGGHSAQNEWRDQSSVRRISQESLLRGRRRDEQVDFDEVLERTSSAPPPPFRPDARLPVVPRNHLTLSCPPVALAEPERPGLSPLTFWTAGVSSFLCVLAASAWFLRPSGTADTLALAAQPIVPGVGTGLAAPVDDDLAEISPVDMELAMDDLVEDDPPAAPRGLADRPAPPTDPTAPATIDATNQRDISAASTEADSPAVQPMADAPPTANAPADGQQLTRAQVRATMAALRPALLECADGAHGQVSAQLRVTPDGRVGGVRIYGDFAGSAAGSCMARALREAQFRTFAGDALSLRFPYQL